MKKIYFIFLLLLLCTASVFNSQLYNNAHVKACKSVAPVGKYSGSIISNMIALPPFR